jgi:hypothetical protein
MSLRRKLGKHTNTAESGWCGLARRKHRGMTPLSVALTVRLGATLESRQIRIEAELGFHEEGGGVAALIG